MKMLHLSGNKVLQLHHISLYWDGVPQQIRKEASVYKVAIRHNYFRNHHKDIKISFSFSLILQYSF